MAPVQNRSVLTLAMADLVDDQYEAASPMAYWVRDPVEGEVDPEADRAFAEWKVLVIPTKVAGFRIRVPFKALSGETYEADDLDGLQSMARTIWLQLCSCHTAFNWRKRCSKMLSRIKNAPVLADD